MALRNMTHLLRNVLISSILFAPTVFFDAFAQEQVPSLSLAGVKKELRIKQQKWKASNNSIANLSDSEKRLMLGVPLSSIEEPENYGKHLDTLAEVLPEEFDWRSNNNKNFISPVKNQGRCGSCVAFAVASTFESQMNIVTNSPSLPWAFSPQHLFSCGGGTCASGWQATYAIDFLNYKGIPEEACFPYKSGAMGEDIDCKQTCSDAKSRSVIGDLRVRSQVFTGASIEQVKQALLGGPVISTFKVFEDFYFYKSGVYRHTTGKVKGGHAVMIIGWSNSNKAWIVRNSWGTDWGISGDFLIAWDDPGYLGGTFYGLEPAKNFSAVVLEGPHNNAYQNGTTTFTVKTTNSALSEAFLEIRGNKSFLTKIPFNANGKIAFDTTQISDGAYTVQARIKAENGEEKISQAHILYVRNGQITGTIKIERMKRNMNVWETIIPQFRVSSTPVPFASIRYKVLNTKGEEVLTRTASHSADLIAMSLNPKGLPLGHYTMIAEGLSDDGKVIATHNTEFNVISAD